MIYEVAVVGLIGNIRAVEKTSLYEFFDVLSYLRAQSDYRNHLMK